MTYAELEEQARLLAIVERGHWTSHDLRPLTPLTDRGFIGVAVDHRNRHTLTVRLTKAGMQALESARKLLGGVTTGRLPSSL